MADRHVDADHVAALLVDDRVEGQRRFAGLPVADHQLALPASDGNHGVDGLDPGLQRLFHRLPVDHAGRQALHRIELRRLNRTLAVDRLADSIHHAPDHGLTHRHRHDARRAAHLVAFADVRVIAQQHRAHLILFQVHGDARNVVRKLDQLARHHFLETVDAGNAIAYRDHRARLAHIDDALVILNLLPQQGGYFVCSHLSHNCKSPGKAGCPARSSLLSGQAAR